MFVCKKHLSLLSEYAKAPLQSTPERKSKVKLTLPSLVPWSGRQSCIRGDNFRVKNGYGKVQRKAQRKFLTNQTGSENLGHAIDEYREA